MEMKVCIQLDKSFDIDIDHNVNEYWMAGQIRPLCKIFCTTRNVYFYVNTFTFGKNVSYDKRFFFTVKTLNFHYRNFKLVHLNHLQVL